MCTPFFHRRVGIAAVAVSMRVPRDSVPLPLLPCDLVSAVAHELYAIANQIVPRHPLPTGPSHHVLRFQLWHPSHGYVNNWDGARGEYFRDYKQA